MSSFRLVALASILSAGACSLPDTSERGFGSRQVLHVRDLQLGLRDFTWDATGIYLARTVPGIDVGNGIDSPYDRSLLDLAAGDERPIASGVLSVHALPPASGPGRSLVMLHFPLDADIPPTLPAVALPPLQLTVLDEVTGTRVEISNVTNDLLSLGATREEPIAIDRSDPPPAPPQLWAGSPDALLPMPAGIQQFVGRDRSGFLGLTNASNAAGTTPALSSFTRYPFDGSAPAPIINGIVTKYTAVSAPGETTATGYILDTTQDSYPLLACPSAPPSDPSPVPPCLLFYDGALTDGSSRGFMRDLDTATTFGLPGALVSGPFAGILHLAPGGSDAFWDIKRADGAGMEFFGWHVGDAAAATCVIPPPPGLEDPNELELDGAAWRPGAGQFSAIIQPPFQLVDPAAAWILVAGTTGGECHAAASGPGLIYNLTYAADGSRLAFLADGFDNSNSVYLADGDAGGAQVIATGAEFESVEFHDPQHLLLQRANVNGDSLSWLSVDTAPATEHAIAERVPWSLRPWWAWLTPRWVLLGDDEAPADGSFSLHVVNIETGESRLVSRGVVDFRASWITPPPDATELLVVYIVQGRTPTAQDGVWEAHLSLSDFPP